MFFVLCCCSNTEWRDSTGQGQRETSHRCGATVRTPHSMTTNNNYYSELHHFWSWYFTLISWYFDVLENPSLIIILFSHMFWHTTTMATFRSCDIFYCTCTNCKICEHNILQAIHSGTSGQVGTGSFAFISLRSEMRTMRLCIYKCNTLGCTVIIITLRKW